MGGGTKRKRINEEQDREDTEEENLNDGAMEDIGNGENQPTVQQPLIAQVAYGRTWDQQEGRPAPPPTPNDVENSVNHPETSTPNNDPPNIDRPAVQLIEHKQIIDSGDTKPSPKPQFAKRTSFLKPPPRH